MKFYIGGDTHGDFMRYYDSEIANNPNNGIIILGDSGLNFRGLKSKIDHYTKEKINSLGCQWYIVHGNHDRRPSDVPTMRLDWDDNVHGSVYTEPDFPNIHYFRIYGIYQLNEYICGVAGGAYSVDKNWRLQNHYTWFENEQMSSEEMAMCQECFNGVKFDFIFAHTCPYSVRPTELFLGGVEQSKVDNTMEYWFDQLVKECSFNAFLFGHYHDDMLIRPHYEMYYQVTESLDDIAARWKKYDETGELEWWTRKSRDFYMN